MRNRRALTVDELSRRECHSGHTSCQRMTISTKSSPNPAFVTTAWSDVEIFHQEGPAAEAARERVCQAYWRPLYVYLRVFLRNRGADAEQAQDLIQAFFEHVFGEQILPQAKRGDGKFRCFLITALQNFVKDEWKHAQRKKRRSEQGWVYLDDAAAAIRYESEFARFDSPEKAFDRDWALQILERSLRQVREHYIATGKATFFDVIEPLLQGSDENVVYAELAGQVGMNAGAFKVAVHRSRQRFRDLVKCAVARTVGWQGKDHKDLEFELKTDNELKKRFDEEMAHLLAALS